MKFASVIIALTAATVAVAGPVSFKTREDSASVELNDIDHAAIDYLVFRGLFDERSLKSRGFLDKFKSKGKDKAKSSSKQPLTIVFRDPTDTTYPISDNTKKAATKALKEAVGEEHLEMFPFCDVTFGNGRGVKYMCFKTAAKKVGDIGASGAFPLY